MLSIEITMSLLIKIIVILTLHQISLESSILDEENVKLSLQYLCPGVDICNRNALTSNVNPNEVDERGFTSCCHGCSCSNDCHININCCFPSDKKAKSISNTSFVNIDAPVERGRLSLISDQNNLLWNEDSPSIGTNSLKHNSTNATLDIGSGIKTIDHSHIDIENRNISIDIELAMKQCMYIKTGTADESWVGRVQAVRMVTSPPPGGCKSNTICPTLTQQSEQATCNPEDIFPWGDFFPVYSADYKLIFKNELCACCYGIMNYTPWLPMLECDSTERDIPISEHFSFLKQPNMLSNYCTVAFQGVDTPLLENECFMDSIGTCRETDSLRVPDGVNLTRSEIVTACSSEPYAPVKLIQGVYKNVFCAMCNVNVYVDRLQCFAGDNVITSKGFAGKGFAYLLDTTSIKKLTQNGKGDDEVFPYPIACLKNQGVWIEESCRTIRCPSGQIRIDGVCSFPSKRWMFRGGIEVTVNLKYITSHTSVLRMLRNEKDMVDKVVNAFRKTSPWPSDWIITRIYHTSEHNNFSPQLVICLNTNISLPNKLMVNIKSSLRRKWNIVLNGMGITFGQSFMKYELTSGLVRNEYEPQWLMHVEEFESFINVSVNESSSFEIILTPFSFVIPFALNKLVICEQITLMKHENTIMAGGLILLNKLSNKIMFSFEFESVEDENGEVFPRICLTDSPLILRRENNGASTMIIINLNLVWAMFSLKWIFVSNCAPIE